MVSLFNKFENGFSLFSLRQSIKVFPIHHIPQMSYDCYVGGGEQLVSDRLGR